MELLTPISERYESPDDVDPEEESIRQECLRLWLIKYEEAP